MADVLAKVYTVGFMRQGMVYDVQLDVNVSLRHDFKTHDTSVSIDSISVVEVDIDNNNKLKVTDFGANEMRKAISYLQDLGIQYKDIVKAIERATAK